jgi:hypothetical protein
MCKYEDLPRPIFFQIAILYMKNGVFWDVTPCGSCKIPTRATRRNIPEDVIIHSHRRENLKSYNCVYIFQYNT